MFEKKEFQAVILALGQLYPLTENNKALLPIGNKPMLAYSLQWLNKAQIQGKKSDFIFRYCHCVLCLCSPRSVGLFAQGELAK